MAIWLGFFLKIFLYWLLKFLYFSIFIEGKLIGWEVFSLNKVSSNHWFREIKEILLDPEDGIIVRVNKNTYWRKTLTEGDISFNSVRDDVKDLNSFKNNVTKALWISYTAITGVIIKLIWGD